MKRLGNLEPALPDAASSFAFGKKYTSPLFYMLRKKINIALEK